MPRIEVALALRDDAQALIVERLNWDEEVDGPYTGPVSNRSAKLFRYMTSFVQRQKLFRTVTAGGRDYTLWALMFNDSGNVLQLVADELDALTTAYPNHIIIAGAWKWDGAMVGCQLVETEVPNPAYTGEPEYIPNPDYQPDQQLPNVDEREFLKNPAYVPEFLVERTQTGTPTYPLDTRLWRFLPDPLPDGSSPSSNADLVNINLLYSQRQRVFA